MYGFSLLQHCKSHSTLQPPGARLGEVGCANRWWSRSPLNVLKAPFFLALHFNLKIWGCTCWKGRLLAGANLSFSFFPVYFSPPPRPSSSIPNTMKEERKMTVRRQKRDTERNGFALLVCCAVLWACNKAQNVTGSNSHPRAAWDCVDLCTCALMRYAHRFFWED